MKLKSNLTKKGLFLIVALSIVLIGVALAGDNIVAIKISEEELPEEMLTQMTRIRQIKEGKIEVLKQFQQGIPEGGETVGTMDVEAGSIFFDGSIDYTGDYDIWHVSIPASTPAVYMLRVAILWSEFDNDIDLYLYNPLGELVDYSIAVDTLTEEVSATYLMAGTWTIKVYGFSIPHPPQFYYGAVDIR